MPNPYPTELRERAVRAYESGSETYAMVASDFSVSEPTLQRWVRR
jgi:transposase